MIKYKIYDHFGVKHRIPVCFATAWDYWGWYRLVMNRVIRRYNKSDQYYAPRKIWKIIAARVEVEKLEHYMKWEQKNRGKKL